jgi:hypothetical protein
MFLYSLPLLPPTVAATGRGHRAKPGRRQRRRPTFPRVVEKRVGALLNHGGGAPRKTLVRRGRETMVWWRCAGARMAELREALVAAGDRLTQLWAPWASDGLGWAPDGLGRARSLRFAVLSVGGDDGSARVGTSAWPTCCSRAAGALWDCLGPAGPAWA